MKNNLYAVKGLLTKEKNKILKSGNPAFASLVDDLSNRIENLSTVHTLLSASKWKPIKLTTLCKSVATPLLMEMIEKEKASLHIAPSDVYIDSFQTQQLAFVINEIVTNSIKYCKPDSGTVALSINTAFDNEHISIEIRDNGRGFPQRILNDNFNNIGIGFDLIFGIIKKSLGGSIRIRNENGAVFDIKIKRMELSQTPEEGIE